MNKETKLNTLKISGLLLAIVVLCTYCFRKLIIATDATVIFQRLMVGTMLITAVAIIVASFLAVKKKWPLYKLYPILGITFGIVFMLIIPTDSTPDEIAHLDSTYLLSSKILGIDEIENPWNLMQKRNCDWTYEEHELSMENYGKYFNTFGSVSDESLQLKLGKNDSTGKPYPYIIGALGVSLARLLHLNFGWMTVIGTLFQLLFFVGVVTYSLKVIPFGKRTLFAIALLPMTLQQVSSFSYDNMMITCGILVTALFLKWYNNCNRTEGWKESENRDKLEDKDKSVSRSHWIRLVLEVIAFVLAAFMMATTKGGAYAVLVLLPLMIAVKKKVWRNTKVRVGMMAFAGVAVLAIIVMYNRGTLQLLWEQVCLEHYIPSSDAYGAAPITFFTEPLTTLSRLAATGIANGKIYLYSMVGGLLGWLQLVINGKIIWTILLVLILTTVRTRTEKMELSKGLRFVMILLSLLSMLICVLAMMYLWTPAGAMVVEGVQGRYFLPALLSLFIGVGLWKKPCWPTDYVDDYFVIAIGFLDYLVIASVLLIFI